MKPTITDAFMRCAWDICSMIGILTSVTTQLQLHLSCRDQMSLDGTSLLPLAAV